jgi:chromosome segregation ATPase
MNLSGKKLTTAILAGLMGATMFGGSVFADSALEAVQTLALQNSNQIDVLTGRVDKLAAASSDATQNTKDIATNKDNIAKNAGAITTNEKAIADEATARTDADTKLNTRITNVKEYLENQTAANYVSKTDAAVQDGAVVKADNTIGENVTNLDGALAKETAARIGADKAQDAVIQQVNQNVADGFKAINNNIGTITDQLNKNDLAEQQARAAKDTEHDNAIAANKQAISTTNTYVEQNMQGISDNRDSIGKINGILNGTDGTGNSGLIKQVNDNTTGIAENKNAISTTNTYVEQNMQGISDNRDSIGKINGILNGTDGTGTSGLIGKVDALQKDSATVKDAATLINANKDAIKNVGDYEKRLSTVERTSKNNAAAIGFKKNGTAVKEGKFVHELSQNTEEPSKSVTIGTNLNALDDAISTTNTYVEQNMQGISDNRDSIGKINGILNGTDGTGNSGLIKQVNDNTTGIADEAKTRADADTALDNKKADKSYVTQKFSAVGEQLDKQSDRITTAQNGVNANAKQIDANKQQIAKNVETLDNHEGRITGNETNIANNATNISKEISARQDADQNLQTQINNNNTSVNNEAAERKAADQNLQNQINNNSTSINDLYGRYSSLKTDINKVGARSAALAGLHPLDFDPANKLNFAVASGSFKGENSVALGAFYRPNENIMFSAASTMGDSDNAYTFGLSFKIGPSSAKTKTTSPDAEELYKVVGELQDQLAAQQKEIEQLKANKAK